MFPLKDEGAALSAERIARYSRQLALPGFGESAQRRLAAARVLVIGAGGLGSALVPVLAGAGVGTIGVVDDDVVELSNLHRQLSHGVADIGRPKVDSLADTVRAIDPAIDLIPHSMRLTSQNILKILADYDLLVDGSDNFPTRYLADDAATLAGKPLVWGSILRFHGQVGVSWSGRGPTFRDLFPAPPPADETLSCEVGGVLPSLCTAIGSFMASEVIKLVTGIGDPLLGRVLFYDSLGARTREIEYAPIEAASPVVELIDYDLFCGIDTSEGPPAVSATELLARQRSGERLGLLDVRRPDETAQWRIPGAELLPLAAVLAGAEPDASKAEPLVIYCHTQVRSRQAAQVLAARGYDVSYLAGGIVAFAGIGGEIAGADDIGAEAVQDQEASA